MKFNSIESAGVLARVRRRRYILHLMMFSLFPGLMQYNDTLMANPQGSVVVHGDVRFNGGAGNLQILQNSQNAIIHWDKFSIDAGELTQFRQPGANSSVLNRVTGGDPSAIHGALKANGNVFVINPNGILVGPSGTIDVHGLVLSTLDVSNGEFLAGGDMTFKGSGNGGVTNMGRINAIGGDVFLIGQTVSNRGSISASSGRVGLAAGQEVLLTAHEGADGERMFVRPKGGSGSTGIENDGTIEGAAVELKAHGNVYALAINNKGSIRATGAVNEGGKVYLRGAGGAVENSGSIKATSSDPVNAGRIVIEAAYARVDGRLQAQGGDVRVTGTDRVELGGSIDVVNASGKGGTVVVEGSEISVDSTGRINARGAEGGTVRIGGGFQGKDRSIVNSETLAVESGSQIHADGTNGQAGTVILWSDGGTNFQGNVSAEATGQIGNGGFVEVSGKGSLLYDGSVSTLSANGQAGTLLLDPTNLTISSAANSSNNINVTTLTTALSGGNVVVSTQSGGAEAGDLTVNNAVTYSSANALTLLVNRDIRFNASVQNAGAGAINAVAGWDGTTGFSGITGLNQPGSVNFQNFITNVSSYGNGNSSIYVGSGSQTTGIAVGSAGGATRMAAYALNVSGGAASDAFAQLGYRPTAAGTISGSISAQLKGGGLNLTAGNQTGAFAQVGHGGTGATATGVSLAAAIDIKFSTGMDGDVNLSASTSASHAYAQIGHGGNNWKGAKSGSITIDQADHVTLTGGGFGNNVEANGNSYAQIGHGGAGVTSTWGNGNASGNISVTNTLGKVSLTAGGGSNGYAQIGNGGLAMSGTSSGEILVHAGVGGVLVQGGTGGRANAQIGNGSYNADYAISGNVSLFAKGLSANDGITLQGGSGASSGAMLGSGHYFINNTTVTGNTSVDVKNGGISMTGGGGSYAYAVIGHANRGDTSSNTGASTMSGTVGVTIHGGNLSMSGGTGTMTSAQIGHGGNNIAGTKSDAITVDVAGAISLTGNSGSAAYAQIGHGGVDSLGSASGALNVTAGSSLDLLAGIGGNAYVQIGHGGGFGSVSSTPDVLKDDITVLLGGKVTVTSKDATGTYAMIGHGGRNHASDRSGDITVVSGLLTQGGVSLISPSGGNTSRFAQIGHGVSGGAGSAAGNVTVIAARGGNITLDAATTSNHSPAIIGHGATATAVSSLSGGLRVFADGNIEATGTYARIAHVSSGNVPGTYTAGPNSVGYQIVANGATNIEDTALGGTTGVNTLANANYGNGPIRLTLNNDIDITLNAGTQVDAGSGNDLAILTGGNLTVNRGYQNNADGNVILVAGWKGWSGSGSSSNWGVTYGASGTDYGNSNLVLNGTTGYDGCGDFGIGNKAVTIGYANQVRAVRVGSRQGLTMLAGYGLTLNASTTTANSGTQLGFYGDGSGDASGAIRIGLSTGGLTLNSGSLASGYTQIGHGGIGSSTGNTTASATITISFCQPGDVILNGSTGTSAYAQIGHGGRSTSGTRNGAISITGYKNLNLNGGNAVNYGYAQIGHGGANANFGNITNASITLSGTGNAAINGGGTNTHAMIGHGGHTATGTVTTSSISLDMVGGITLQGGLSATDSAGAQIGHGGHNAHNLQVIDSNILINQATGTGTGDVLVNGGATNSYAMIGHGGSRADVTIGTGNDSSSGNIDIARAANIRVVGGNNTDGVAQIGHGGERSPGTHSGSITVKTSGEVEVRGGTGGNYAIAMIGHGGTLARGAAVNTAAGMRSGVIQLTAAGAIKVSGGAAQWASAQIGHGGNGVIAAHDGAVKVAAGTTLNLKGGNGSNAYAQIGHGGVFDLTPSAPNTLNGDICVQVGGKAALETTDVQGGYAMIGHGGRNHHSIRSGNISVVTGLTTQGGVTLTSVSGTIVSRFAQIGHGGTGVKADTVSGNVTVVAERGGDIALNALSSDAYNAAIIGHGSPGVSSGTISGGLNVFADGNITATGTYARIAHVVGASVPVSYTAGADSVGYQIVANGKVTATDAQLGSAAGVNTMVNANFGSAPIRLTLPNAIDITIDAGTQVNAGAGDDLVILTGGNITINRGYQNNSTGNVVLVSGWNGGSGAGSSGNWGVAYGSSGTDYCNPQILLLGSNALAACGDFGNGNKTVTIGSAAQTQAVRVGSRQGTTLIAGYGLTMNASTAAANSDTHLGFYGDGSGDMTGAIDVRLRAGGLTMNSGNQNNAYTQIGHGGLGSTNGNTTSTATITISFCQPGDVILNGSIGTSAYAQIGHGGAAPAGHAMERSPS